MTLLTWFRKKSGVGFLYFSSIFIFAGIYQQIWSRSPDAFILNREFNLLPYSDAGLAGTGESGFQEAMDLDQLYFKVVRPARIKIDELNRRLKELNSKREATEANLREAAKAHLTAAIENRRKVEEQELRGLSEEIRTLEEAKANLDALSIQRAEYGVAAANLGIRLAQRRVEYAQGRVSLYDRFLRDFPAFSDPGKAAVVSKLNEELRDISAELQDVQRQIVEVQRELRGSLETWSQERVKRLGFVDFLYFSIGVSTTVTFGDIIPNSRGVRVAVALQLVSSVLLVGYFVGLLTSSHSGARV